MILLVSAVHDDLAALLPHPHLGRLAIPRLLTGIEDSAAAMPWAADNDAFGGFGERQEQRFRDMLDRIGGLRGCRFVTAPDVVGDAAATADQWTAWAPQIASHGLPVGWVAQDGADADSVPADASAVFVGGTDAFKISGASSAIIARARSRGLWVHMGRVNSLSRMRIAARLGCDSVDGTCFARWRRTHLPNGLRWAAAASADASAHSNQTTMEEST